jgi:hypothetical protein
MRRHTQAIGRIWAAAAALLCAVGCAPISTTAAMAPSTPVARYRSWAWYKGQAGAPESLAEQEMRASLERNLADKGLTQSTSGSADFLVSYHTKQQQKVQVTPGYGYGYGYWGYGWGGFPDVTTYTEGTLIVDFIDPVTNQVFWRGTASSVVEHPNNPNPQRIDKAVSKLMSKYPSQMASGLRQRM